MRSPDAGENGRVYPFTAACRKALKPGGFLILTDYFAASEEVVCDIRDRYDGEKRSPFDEAECGHHYARALAAWSVFKAFCAAK